MIALTDRQRQIAKLYALGQPEKSIACDLKISPYTVKRHVSDIYERLGVNDRVALIYCLLRAGVIQVDSK